MEFWIVAEGVRRRSGTEMDHLEASGEGEGSILFWVNIPVLIFDKDISIKAHLQRLPKTEGYYFITHNPHSSFLTPHLRHVFSISTSVSATHDDLQTP